MAKQIFRFLRGELTSGFYLRSIQDMLNNVTSSIKSFLIRFNDQQFELKSMTDKDLYGIGTTAGVFLPVLDIGEAFGALHMTESNKVNGVERSERGLLEQETETFEFKHTEQDDYAEDINTLAETELRSSMIGLNDTIQGYISSTETDVLEGQGVVKPSKVLSTPPENVAYSDFYGSKFLYLAEILNETRQIDINIYYLLYIEMQKIRYNGVNIESVCSIINTICPEGLVKIDRLEKVANSPVFILYYYYDESARIGQRVQRLTILRYLFGYKCPQILLSEIIEQ